LYRDFLELKTPSAGARKITSVADAQKYKCAFGLASDIKLNFNKFSPIQKATIASLLTRPVNDTSIVSPAGHFRIHYDTKGTNKPLYSIPVLAAAADSAYNIEIGTMGFPAPPGDSGAGGDDLYDIYIVNIYGYYGYTQMETQLSDRSYASYQVIDSDFLGYYTTGINAAKVTVAHEFHHAVQVGSYPYRSADKWYHELTSTSMEEFVFDYINDYYFYQSAYFENPDWTISQHEGYDMAIWHLYLKDRFGLNLFKKIWEYILNYRALKAISLAIEDNSSTFRNEFSKFNMWTFYTGYRAVAGKYFKEAKNYPLLKPAMSLAYTSPSKSIISQTSPVSNNIFLFVNNTQSSPDSIYAVITNADYLNGFENPASMLQCTYTLSSSSAGGARQISPSYFVKLESIYPELLKESDILNNVLIDDTSPVQASEINDPFPQPFNYSRHSNVAIPVPGGASEESLLYIYTLNMKQVYSGSLKVYSTDKIFVRWNGLDANNSKLPNGVYFYVTQRDDKIFKGKVVIQNE
jgi:hypothetical protein